jgi:hypothetical protein
MKQNPAAGFLGTLLPSLDARLATEGFERRGLKNVRYTRLLANTKQRLEIVFHVRPRYEPSAELHVYPMVEVQMGSVNDIALAMVRDGSVLGGSPESTLRQPLEMAIPRERQTRWFVRTEVTYREVSDQVVESVWTWGIPFLDEYCSAADLVRGYERRDERLLMQQHFAVYVAAAYVVLDRLDEAMALLNERLGSVGLRQRYAGAFEYVRARLGSSRKPEADEIG